MGNSRILRTFPGMNISFSSGMKITRTITEFHVSDLKHTLHVSIACNEASLGELGIEDWVQA